MSAAAAFAPLRLALDEAAVRFAVGGSWASTAFGEPRLTNDVDILADFTPTSLPVFISKLPPAYYADLDEALAALRLGRSFNVIYMPEVFKFDFFPAKAFLLGETELNRAVLLENTELSESATPFVTPEDILLAKLYWFRTGGEVSEVQWRDILGVARTCAARLDRAYLDAGAAKLGISSLLAKALAETAR